MINVAATKAETIVVESIAIPLHCNSNFWIKILKTRVQVRDIENGKQFDGQGGEKWVR